MHRHKKVHMKSIRAQNSMISSNLYKKIAAIFNSNLFIRVQVLHLTIVLVAEYR